MKAVRGEHKLLLEAQHVVGNYSIVLFEGTESLNFFDFSNHAIT